MGRAQVTAREKRLFQVLRGISVCATRCDCCQMLNGLASQAIETYRASLTRDEAIELEFEDRLPATD